MPISLRSTPSISIAMICCVLLVGCNGSDEQAGSAKSPIVRPVKVITAKPTKTVFQRSYAAVILPSQEADLSFRVSGRIIELPIRNGIRVKKGDVIAQLDTRDFKASITQINSQLEQATEQMDALKAGARAEDIATLQADVSAAQAQLNAAISQVARTKELFDKKIIAKVKLDQDVTSQEVAQAALEAKQQALIKGQAGARKEDLAAQQAVIDGVKSQLESAKDNLSDATLRAPFDGIIATRKVENFSNIQAKDTVATLQNIKILNATFDVPAPDVARLAKFKKLDLKISIESIPGKIFSAERNEFSTQADTATQTYRGRVTIEDLGGEIVLPGMTGNLIITAGQESDSVFMLPITAIASAADGKPFVWIVNSADNKTSKRVLVTGEASGGTIIVSDGLKDGDLVVTAGLSALQDNMVVKPVTVIGE